MWQRFQHRVSRVLTSQAGVGVVELLIAAFVTGLVSMAAFEFYKSQHSQFTQQADVSEMQQNLRTVMDELTRQIRRAGYRAYGSDAVQILGANDWLLVNYHDGTSVRTQLFYLYDNAVTGQRDLMTMLNGEGVQTFAEGIDSVRFTGGGTGAGIEWVTIDLVAKSRGDGFKSATTGGPDKHLYRRLSSTVKLRNR